MNTYSWSFVLSLSVFFFRQKSIHHTVFCYVFYCFPYQYELQKAQRTASRSLQEIFYREWAGSVYAIEYGSMLM